MGVTTGVRDYTIASSMHVDLSPDGCQVALVPMDDTAVEFQVFEFGKLMSHAFQNTKSSHEDIIYSLKFSPDGSMLVTASADSTAKIWVKCPQGYTSPGMWKCRTTCRLQHSQCYGAE